MAADWGSKNKALVDAIFTESEPAAHMPRAPEAKAMLEKERRSVPPGNVATLTALFAWLLVTGAVKDVVRCGSAAFWALTLSIAPLVAAVMAVVRRRLIGKQRLKADVRALCPALRAAPPVSSCLMPSPKTCIGRAALCPRRCEPCDSRTRGTLGVATMQVGLVPEVGDINWTPRTTLTYPAACSCAGVIAGMFGVGGGIVKGPLMLHLGVLPEVAAATSATMILFTAGARP